MSLVISVADSHDSKPSGREYKLKFEFVWKSLGSYIISALCYNLSPDMLGYFSKREDEPSLSQEMIVMLFVCLPMLYMQINLGKYTQSGIFHIQYMIPIAKGLAYMFIINVGIAAVKCGYYMTDIFLYFLLSFQIDLPWKTCLNTSKYEISELCYDKKIPPNCTVNISNCQHAAKIFWTYVYMDNPEENAKPVLQRFVSLWLSWFIIFAIVNIAFLKKGRVYTVLVLLFSICFFSMLIGALFSHGSSLGITAMFTLHSEYYLSINKWTRAVTKTTKIMTLGQTFHILSGARMTASTPSDIWCITFLITFVFIITLFSVFTYGILGIGQANIGLTMANYTQISIYDMYFIYVPGYLSYLNAPQCWCIVFFGATLCILLLNTISRLLAILLSITNHVRYMMKYRIYLLASFCVTGAIIGSIMLPGTSLETTQLFFNETAALIELLAATFLSIFVFWIYSVQTLGDDIHFAVGQQPAKFWKISWYLSPIIYTFTIMYDFYIISKYFRENLTFHFTITAVAASPVFIFGTIQFFVYLKKRRLIGLLQSEVEWGVPDPEERHMRRSFNPRKQIRSKARRYQCKHKCLGGSKIHKLTHHLEEEHRKEIFDDNQLRVKRILD